MRDIATWWVWIPYYLSLIFLILKNIESIQRIILTFAVILLCLVSTQVLGNLMIQPFFANLFGFVTIVSLLVRNKLLTSFMSAWAIILCLAKIYLGQYTIWGILLGLVLGLILAYLYYMLLRYIDRRGDYYTHRRYVSRKLTITGFSVVDINPVYSIFILTLLIILLHSVIKA